jgi:hypothetical protein
MTTDTLSALQTKAIMALMSEASIQAAAKVAGTSERTLHRWLDDPEFSRVYSAARRKAMQHAITTLQRGASGAAEALATIACDVDEKGSTRVQAARAVIELGLRTIELEDLEARIAALEARHENA